MEPLPAKENVPLFSIGAAEGANKHRPRRRTSPPSTAAAAAHGAGAAGSASASSAASAPVRAERLAQYGALPPEQQRFIASRETAEQDLFFELPSEMRSRYYELHKEVVVARGSAPPPHTPTPNSDVNLTPMSVAPMSVAGEGASRDLDTAPPPHRSPPAPPRLRRPPPP